MLSGAVDKPVISVVVRTKDVTCTLDGLLPEQGLAIAAEVYRHKYPPAAECRRDHLYLQSFDAWM